MKGLDFFCWCDCLFVFVGVPDQSWDEAPPAGTGFGQDAPAAPAADEWGAAPAAGAAGQLSTCTVFGSGGAN